VFGELLSFHTMFIYGQMGEKERKKWKKEKYSQITFFFI